MRIRQSLIICCLIALTFTHQNLDARVVRLKKTVPLQEQLITPHTIYVVKHKFDLHGSILEVPEYVSIKIKKGGIVNGTIIGNHTELIVSRRVPSVFKDISISGKWNNKEVRGEWLDFSQDTTCDNYHNFVNLMCLANGDCLTNVYMQSGEFYTSIPNNGSALIIPSNTCFHNEATIKVIPNSWKRYSLIYINNVTNVTIDGGMYVGDVIGHKSTEGEWGHGIKCSGATNVLIKNLALKEFWGDGIDLIEGLNDQNEAIVDCRNVQIINVRCLHNRRQGLSIEAAHDVLIKDSEFAFTGYLKSTLPSAGVDIEPWQANGPKISNITFDSCSFHDNYGYDLHVVPNRLLDDKAFVEHENSILLHNCNIGLLNVGSANGITFRSCQIGDSVKSLKGRGGFVAGNNLGILKVYRSNMDLCNSTIINNIEDIFVLDIQNTNTEMSLNFNMCDCSVTSNGNKKTGKYLYAFNLATSNCRLSNNIFNVSQGLIFRSSVPQKSHEQIVISDNTFNLIANSWYSACLTFRTLNNKNIYNNIEIYNNAFAGFKSVLANDNNSHTIRYAGKTNIPIEQFKSMSKIHYQDGSVRSGQNGLEKYENGSWNLIN